MGRRLRNRRKTIWSATVNDRRECLAIGGRMLPFSMSCTFNLAYLSLLCYDFRGLEKMDMAKTKYYIRLTEEERTLLTRIVCEEKESERTIMRARILLMSDAEKAEKCSIRELAERLGTTETTIKTVRTEYATKGFEAALYRKKRVVSKVSRKINDDVVRQVLELASSEPPAGKKRWSSKMICEELMAQGVVKHIGQSAVCKILREAGDEE